MPIFRLPPDTLPFGGTLRAARFLATMGKSFAALVLRCASVILRLQSRPHFKTLRTLEVVVALVGGKR